MIKPAIAPMLLAVALASVGATAQEVQDIHPTDAPPDMISPTAPPSAPLAAGGATAVTPVSLGQNMDGPAQGGNAGGAPASGESVNGSMGETSSGGVAGRAAQAAQAAAKSSHGKARGKGGARLRNADTGKDDAIASGPVERVTFERAPIRVPLPLDHERLITLPAAAALHVPSDMDRVAKIQNIDRTLYVTALAPFTPIRIVAELLDSGQQIPMDFLANTSTAMSTGELQVSVIDAHGGAVAKDGAADDGQSAGSQSGTQTTGLDMVELTRFASHQLYAPKRLAYRVAGVNQVGVALTPVPELIRGVNADIVPMGQWKSGPLYVTAVRVTNRSRFPLEIPLEQLRGDWIAATAQHGRIGAAGTESDTTAIYLVCERRFEACLQQ